MRLNYVAIIILLSGKSGGTDMSYLSLSRKMKCLLSYFFSGSSLGGRLWTAGRRLLGGHTRQDGGFVRALRGSTLRGLDSSGSPPVSLSEDAASEATGWGGFRAWESQSCKEL